MSRRLQNYVQTFRKRAGLSQQDVAMLLGCSNGAKVSRYERFSRRPTLSTALAYEQLFHVPVRELFAGVDDEAREALRHRAHLLAEQLEKQSGTAVARKRQFLETPAVEQSFTPEAMMTEKNVRYLAVHPTTYGLGFAVFEEDLRLIDWGAYRARGDKNQRCLLFLNALIKRYEPRVLLLEDRERRERQRSERIQRLIHSIRTNIRRTGMAQRRIPRRRMQKFFAGQDAKTKEEIAVLIVEWFPELSQHLPPKRKPWMPEHPRMGMFEAIALALTYFDSLETSFTKLNSTSTKHKLNISA